MDIEEIKKQIHLFLLQEFPNESVKLNDDTDLLNEWFMYSVELINMIMFVETNFEISIARGELKIDNFRTISKLAEYIKLKREQLA